MFRISDIVKYSQIYASALSEHTVKDWKMRGANAAKQNAYIVEESDIIFLSVKPHILPAAISDVYKTLKYPHKVQNKLFVSILAGIKLDSLETVSLFKYLVLFFSLSTSFTSIFSLFIDISI